MRLRGLITLGITVSILKGQQQPPIVHPNQSVTVQGAAPDEPTSPSSSVSPEAIQQLPGRPANVGDALPLIPGVLRTPEGQLKISGSGEHRSSLLVNSVDVTDPATGQFGATVPVESVESFNVLKSPFLAEYGRFSAGVVVVDTKRGADKWHFELNDLFPDFRFRSWHMRGVRDVSPRLNFSGPLIANRLYFSQSLQYDLGKTPVITLPFPHNETKKEFINSFTQLDYIVSSKQYLTGTIHIAPQHTDFVNLDFFHPELTTPDYRQHEYSASIVDHLTVPGGLLDNSLSFTRFRVNVGAQGTADYILTPDGAQGNYFSSQSRAADRIEWLDTYSMSPIEFHGTNNLKLGSNVTRTNDNGTFNARTVDILGPDSALLERIAFTGGQPFSRTDWSLGFFAQDHWNLAHRVTVDIGARTETQEIAESLRLAPRMGVSWTPFEDGKTVIRGGFGWFYDRVPLSVYAFPSYPQQAITIGGQTQTYQNVIEQVSNGHSALIHSATQPGNFAPHSDTASIQIERTFGSALQLRLGFLESNSRGLVIVKPETNAFALSGDGQARYRQVEFVAKVNLGARRQLFVSYVNSRTQGDLNEFSGYLGNFPSPVIRFNQFGTLPGTVPNRFLAWGLFQLPMGFRIAPVFEYRNGFPYSQLDPYQNYVGTPDTHVFPHFLSVDARVSRDFKINPKYSVRLAVSGFNLTNHFNPDSVHANIADPQSGIFFGQHKRRYTFDFDVIF